MRIPLLENATNNGPGAEFKHEFPSRDVEGVNIRVWGTIGDATITLQFKAPDNSWVNTSCTFTTVGQKNFLLKADETIRLNITGAGGTNVSADMKP
jgi:hypothetical protein